ncbi:MAG: shikimate dehydrogenase [Balneolaceae bacterium]|nr:shikimate dehydrogenase [Balneolaceae bacterium]MBO6547466.1 shikimate dehydrogenase [Balneolaceae bacterium]MBO6647587.1 shikimate dehydrogenase [Balneolaceae bacterium]
MTFTKFKLSEKSESPHYLLIGNPVSHSVSPLMHNSALTQHGINAEYHAVAVSMSEIPALVAHFNNSNFLGANITIPHKENFTEVMDELTPEAREIGAINTVIKQENKLIGHNTDAYGFQVPLEEFSDAIERDRAIIFGSGGATKAIVYALHDLGFEEVIMVSRRPERYSDFDDMITCSYDAWTEYADDANLIINATPLGMIPNTDASPIKESERELLEGKLCYDIVYNPKETKFLKQAISAGGIAIGGIDMLIHQGAKSFQLWTGKEFPIGLIKMKLDDIFPH